MSDLGTQSQQAESVSPGLIRTAISEVNRAGFCFLLLLPIVRSFVTLIFLELRRETKRA